MVALLLGMMGVAGRNCILAADMTAAPGEAFAAGLMGVRESGMIGILVAGMAVAFVEALVAELMGIHTAGLIGVLAVGLMAEMVVVRELEVSVL